MHCLKELLKWGIDCVSMAESGDASTEDGNEQESGAQTYIVPYGLYLWVSCYFKISREKQNQTMVISESQIYCEIIFFLFMATNKRFHHLHLLFNS